MHFLGLDIGTSAVKAALVDDRQSVIATGAASVPLSQPAPGRFEQNPADWWTACESAVAAVGTAASAALADVGAIGLSGQMHGAVALDAADRPLRPAILWNDSRAVAECVALAAAVPDIAEIAGVVPMPGFTAPKILWLGKHEPDAFARARHFVLAKDFVRMKLTGEIATDMSDAAGTLLLDERRRDWSAPILAAVGIDRVRLPRLLEGNAPSGTLRREVAARWGIARPVVVAAGAGDVAAGAVGSGVIDDGAGFVSLGTAAQIFFCRNHYRPKPETLIHTFAHALPGRWFEMAAILNGAACLAWLAALLGERDPTALLAKAEATASRPSPVLFLPYLAGERTPHNDPDARGVFANLDRATGVGDLVQALLEGVAFSLLDGFNAFGQAVDGESILPIVGGGARSRYWTAIVASVLGWPLARVASGDSGPAFGAARLARLALTGEQPADVCIAPAVEEAVMPDPALQRAYEERFVTFQRLYRALRRVREATADRRPASIR